MIDLITMLSMILFVSPILIGVAAFGGVWFRDEFYKEPFYSEEEDS